MEKKICELFAGVGGFRLGMENLYSAWETVWFSQWEPGKKNQWAHDCYVKHFGDCKDNNGEYHTAEDIASIDKETIPDHTLLLAGFPCQDYSVAHSLSSSRGIEGKKGVLWWQIYEILEKKSPSFCIFENVDRLIKSPAKQRGRDFGIILGCLNKLGYSAEWRVVNAADYEAYQRRRRTFIFAYKNDTKYAKKINMISPKEILNEKGFMQKAFRTEKNEDIIKGNLQKEIEEISDSFKFEFMNAGYMKKGEIYQTKLEPVKYKTKVLEEVLEGYVGERYYVPENKITKWKYLKGKKKIKRISKDGHEYTFSEGEVPFPELLKQPSRTMLTSEGSLNRSTHVIMDPENSKLRILTPVECERLNGFPDEWTKYTTNGEMPERMRYFCMGNSLVVAMITRMGKVLDKIVDEE